MTDEDIEQVRKVAAGCGLELLVGDFIRKDGSRVRFHLRPVDGRKLVKLAMQCPPFVGEPPPLDDPDLLQRRLADLGGGK